MLQILDESTSPQRSMLDCAQAHLKQADPVLAQIIVQQGDCLLKPQRPYFFVLCDAIISQQISVKAAATIVRRFRALYSPQRFPQPAAVMATSEAQLAQAGLSRAKAVYIKDLAAKFLNGTIKYRRFSQLSDEEVISELVSVKGIGRWTAEMFLIFSLNRPDVLPVDDLGLQRAVEGNYQIPAPIKAAQLIEVAQVWRPYRSIATWYLWRSINGAKK